MQSVYKCIPMDKKLAACICFYLTDCIRLQLVCMSVNKIAGNKEISFADKFNVHFPVKLISFTIFIIVFFFAVNLQLQLYLI